MITAKIIMKNTMIIIIMKKVKTIIIQKDNNNLTNMINITILILKGIKVTTSPGIPIKINTKKKENIIVN